MSCVVIDAVPECLNRMLEVKHLVAKCSWSAGFHRCEVTKLLKLESVERDELAFADESGTRAWSWIAENGALEVAKGSLNFVAEMTAQTRKFTLDRLNMFFMRLVSWIRKGIKTCCRWFGRNTWMFAYLRACWHAALSFAMIFNPFSYNITSLKDTNDHRLE